MATSKQDQSFSELMEKEVDTITIQRTALDSAVEFIGNELEPDDVFSISQLETWAENNGYTKEV